MKETLDSGCFAIGNGGSLRPWVLTVQSRPRPVNSGRGFIFHMKIIEILDRPIAFHRSLVKITKSINGALLLSQAIYWQNRPTRESNDGWWYKTAEDFREETGMGRYELDNAKKSCKGILLHRLKGVPARTWYKVDEAELQTRLLETSILETSEQDCRGPALQFAGNQQSISTKTNTETKLISSEGIGSKEAWLIGKKLEAKKGLMEELKRNHTIEVATGIVWQNESARKEYIAYRKEVKELTRIIAGI